MNKVGTRRDGCTHFLFSGGRLKWLGTSISWKRWFRRDHNHHESIGKGEVVDLLQPSLGNYTASFPCHSVFQSMFHIDPGFKGKGKRPCLLRGGVTRTLQPALSDPHYQSAFIWLTAESISLNQVGTRNSHRSRLRLHGDNCSGCTVKMGICNSVLWAPESDRDGHALSLNMNISSPLTDESCRPRSHPVSVRWLALLCFDL